MPSASSPALGAPSSATALLQKGLLALGVLLLASGLISFFAFNWGAMSPALKFGLLVGIMVFACLVALRVQGMGRKASLFVAFIATGVLLATIGQVYQSGADAWQLFAVWAVLGVLWAVAARTALIWVLVLLLAQLAAMRYMNMHFSLLEFFFRGLRHGNGLFPLATAALCLVVWELAWRYRPELGMQGRLGSRTMSMLLLAMGAWIGIEGILERGEGFAAVLGLGSLALLAAYATWLRRDVPVLGFTLLAMNAVLMAAMARGLDFGDFIATSLILGLVFVGIAAAIVSLLRKMLPERPATSEHPWFLNVIMGIAAWIGSLLVLVFLAFLTFSGGAHGGFWAVMGLVLLGLSGVMLNATSNLIRQQFGLAFSLAGQAAVVFGLIQLVDRLGHDGPGFVFGGMLVMYAVLTVVVKYSAHRFLTVVGFWASLALCLSALIGDPEGHFLSNPFNLWAFFACLLLALVALTLSVQGRVNRSSQAPVSAPVRFFSQAPFLYGTLIAIGVCAGFFSLWLNGEMFYQRTVGSEEGVGRAGMLSPFFFWQFASSAVIAMAAWVLAPGLKGASRWLALMVLLLAVAGLSKSPLLFGGLLFVSCALALMNLTPEGEAPASSGKGAKLILLLGVLMGLAGFSLFYYNLSWPLWLKSLVLAGLGGLILLLGHFAFSRRGPQSGVAVAARAVAGEALPPMRALNGPTWAVSPGILVALCFSVLAAAYGIYSKELILRKGEHIFLELRPVDPRSLMQGDYMALNFSVAGEISEGLREKASALGKDPYERDFFVRDGVVPVVLDARRVARLAGQADAPVRKLRFQNGPAGVQISTNSWFFQEGQATRFEQARFGEFVVDAAGQALLVGMRDQDLKPL